MTYGEAMFPARSLVFGVLLQPLTVGHLMVLARLDSPFVHRSESSIPGAGDIGLFFWVCSRPWQTAWRQLGSWRARYRIARFSTASLGAQDAIASSIFGWLNSQLAGPRTRSRAVDASDGRRFGSPEHALIKVALMSELGVSELEALNCPVVRAIWDLAVVSERKGAVTIVGREDLLRDSEFYAAALRMTAQNRARKEGVPNVG